MKKRYLFFITLFMIAILHGYSQNMESFIRPYADAIVEETNFEFTDKRTGEKFPSTNNLPLKQNLIITISFTYNITQGGRFVKRL